MKTKQPRVSGDGLSRETMIKRIYEVIADKTLSRGCVVEKGGACYFVAQADEVKCLCRPEGLSHNNSSMVFLFKDDMRYYKIIGHPIMVGDVLEWLGKKYGEYSITFRGDGTIDFGNYQGKLIMKGPLEVQPEEFVFWLYSLLETNQPTT